MHKKSTTSNGSKVDAASSKSVKSKQSSSKEVAKSPKITPKVTQKPKVEVPSQVEKKPEPVVETVSQPVTKPKVEEAPKQVPEKTIKPVTMPAKAAEPPKQEIKDEVIDDFEVISDEEEEPKKVEKKAPPKQEAPKPVESKVAAGPVSVPPQSVQNKDKLEESIDSAYDSFDDEHSDKKEKVKSVPAKQPDPVKAEVKEDPFEFSDRASPDVVKGKKEEEGMKEEPIDEDYLADDFEFE